MGKCLNVQSVHVGVIQIFRKQNIYTRTYTPTKINGYADSFCYRFFIISGVKMVFSLSIFYSDKHETDSAQIITTYEALLHKI